MIDPVKQIIDLQRIYSLPTADLVDDGIPGKEEAYKTGDSHAEALNRIKLHQRREMAKHIEKGGTILEMFAGRGNLTRAIYDGLAKHHILIEYNKKTIDEYTTENVKTLSATIIHKSNLDYCSDDLPKLQERITCVDFDAFGSVVPIITRFFSNYKIKQKIVIGVTDGIGSNLARISRDETRMRHRLVELGYPLIERKGLAINVWVIHLIDAFMQKIATKYRLKFKKINGTHNRKSTVYCAYIFNR